MVWTISFGHIKHPRNGLGNNEGISLTIYCYYSEWKTKKQKKGTKTTRATHPNTSFHIHIGNQTCLWSLSLSHLVPFFHFQLSRGAFQDISSRFIALFLPRPLEDEAIDPRTLAKHFFLLHFFTLAGSLGWFLKVLLLLFCLPLSFLTSSKRGEAIFHALESRSDDACLHSLQLVGHF